MRLSSPDFPNNTIAFPVEGTAPATIAFLLLSWRSECFQIEGRSPGAIDLSTSDMADHSPSFLPRSLDGELVERTYVLPVGESKSEIDVIPSAFVS